MNTGVGGGGGLSEAGRLLGVAEKLLAARDLVGSKKLAERALESDPLLDGADQVLAVADVLLAAQRRINNHVDWYAVLQLDPASSGRDPAAVRRHYRRLALLLRPDRNRLPGVEGALKLVDDAWAVLSDPSKKTLLDAELEIAAAHLRSGASPRETPRSAAASATDANFWTACPSCCHVFQYERAYEGRSLRCQSCHQAFRAAAIATAPPIVPGTDMYYCSWGFFPLGFPGGPVFSGLPASASVPGLGDAFKPFYPMSPWWGNRPPQPSDQPEDSMNPPGRHGDSPAGGKKGNVVPPQTGTTPRKPPPPPKNRKVVAKKTVGSSFKKRVFVVESGEKSEAGRPATGPEDCEGTEARPVVIDINEKVGCSEGIEVVAGEDDETGSIDIELDAADMDATDELLSNLPNLQFLKDEQVPIQIL